jgi:hypothetical protein
MNNIKKKPWETEEIILLQNCKTIKEAMNALPHRSRASINAKRKLIKNKGVVVNSVMWTKEEEEILYKHGTSCTAEDLHKKYLPNRSPASINSKRRTLGIYRDRSKFPNKRDWTPEDIEILKKYGPMYSAAIIHEKYLPHKTVSSISQKRTNLGIEMNDNREYIDGRVGWSKEEDAILIKELNNYSYREIGEKFLPHRPLSGIKSRGDLLGLTRTPEARAAIISKAASFTVNDHSITLNDLSNTTYQILIGSILGDGCIAKERRERTKGNPYSYVECHALDQEDYVYWKADMLKEFNTRINGITEKYDERYDKTYYKRSFSAPTSSVFKTIREDFYEKRENGRWGKILLPEQWLKKLDLLGLLIWYLDDGRNRVNVLTLPRFMLIVSLMKT